jgi:hypothetical protein
MTNADLETATARILTLKTNGSLISCTTYRTNCRTTARR